MGLSILNRSLLCVLCVAAAVVVVTESARDPSGSLARSHARVSRATSGKRRTTSDGNKPIMDVSMDNLVSAGAPGSCCLNDGLCIMNSFCHCKKNFYGRYCEHRVRHRACGSIRHGTWMAAGCHLCHCYDGQMTCKVTTIRGCDRLPYVEGYEKDPDYMVGMDKKVEDYDKFYDDNEYPLDVVVTSGTASRERVQCALVGGLLATFTFRYFNS